MLTNRRLGSDLLQSATDKIFRKRRLVFFYDSGIKKFLRGEIASCGRPVNSPSFKFAAFLLKSFQMGAMDQSNCCMARPVIVAF